MNGVFLCDHVTEASYVDGMKEAFPGYTGVNHLNMTAGFLFPAEETAG